MNRTSWAALACLTPLLLAPACGPGDASRPDTGVPDASAPDAGPPDIGAPDALAGDTADALGGDADAGPPDAGEPDVPPSPPFVVSQLIAIENPSNPLSFFVSWSTNLPAATELSVDCGDAYRHTLSAATLETAHEVFVMGLIDGLTCHFEVSPGAPPGGLTTTTVEVGPLPAGLPTLLLTAHDEAQMQPGWTLFSVASASQAGDMTVVAIDEQARYRWIYKPGWGQYGSGAELEVNDEGVMIGNASPHAQIVSWEGATVWKLGLPAHHDMRVSPFHEDHVLYLGRSPVGCETTEHTVVEYDRIAEEVVWEWRICEHWTPRVDYQNWSHLNTIEPVPGEQAVLVSSRDQDLILKVNRDTSAVEWTLGRDGDFAMDPADWFYRQHAPEVLDDGAILVFDNGVDEAEAGKSGLEPDEFRTHSRVLELQLSFDADGAPDQADVVWEYTDDTIFAVNRSEADRLANGNTLIHYVWVQPDETVILREVTPDKATVWEVVTPPDVASYRSERIAPTFGYVRAAP